MFIRNIRRFLFLVQLTCIACTEASSGSTRSNIVNLETLQFVQIVSCSNKLHGNTFAIAVLLVIFVFNLHPAVVGEIFYAIRRYCYKDDICTVPDAVFQTAINTYLVTVFIITTIYNTTGT
jgi:hypothetical protein